MEYNTFHGKGDKVSCYSADKATGSDCYYISYGVWQHKSEFTFVPYV